MLDEGSLHGAQFAIKCDGLEEGAGVSEEDSRRRNRRRRIAAGRVASSLVAQYLVLHDESTLTFVGTCCRRPKRAEPK